jgi:hypothetical protein
MSPRALAPLFVGIALTMAAPAAAQDARHDAARAFADGTKAFDAGDYTRAAQSFESAYALAPHEDALWNAARAWHKALELAKAANLYAQYLQEAPPNAPDRAGATAALRALSAKLGRIEVHVGAGVDQVRIDDAPLRGTSAYVVPGMHVLRASSAKGPIEQQQVVKEGETKSVVLAAAADAPPEPVAPPPPPPPPPPIEQPTHSGWSPLVVWIGGGLTLVLAGVTTWSGLDTVSKLHDFESTPTQDALDDGRGKQTRTNVLIGVTAGVAVLTAAAAIFLVDWKSDTTRVGIGPSGVFGSF